MDGTTSHILVNHITKYLGGRYVCNARYLRTSYSQSNNPVDVGNNQ